VQFSRTIPVHKTEPLRQPPPSVERDERRKEKEAVEKMQRDPVWTCENLLGARTLWTLQKEILHSITHNRRTAVASAHGIGKSYTAARAVVSFLLTHPNSIVPTTAPTDRQVKKVLWQEIHRTRGEMTVPCRTTPLVKEWQVAPGWFALGLSCKDPDSFQGLHASSGDILIVVDEASGVPDEIADAVAGSLSSQRARLLSIGNPTNPNGWFAKEFTRPGVKTFNISAFDTPNFTAFGITLEDLKSGEWEKKVNGHDMPYPALVTPVWAAEMLQSWGEESPLFIAKVKGQFPQESEDQIIHLQWVERARSRCVEWEDEEKKDFVPLLPIELGLDVARFGRNETVLALRKGMLASILSRWRGKDTMETTGRVVRALQETKASVVKVDDGGVGGAITDRLKELKLPVEPINASSKARDEKKFFNARAEMWWHTRELLRLDSLLLVSTNDFSQDSILDGQLCAPRYSIDSKGRIQVESKEDMEERGIQSPDRADALLLALYPSKRRKGPICW
jgi:phage terminase large subunit